MVPLTLGPLAYRTVLFRPCSFQDVAKYFGAFEADGSLSSSKHVFGVLHQFSGAFARYV